MCGILGGTAKNWCYEEALQQIAHRGPDGMRVERLSGFTLGFVRLAVIDLSENGMQPMACSDGTVWITYNGEIYGYESLKDDLIKKGYQFISTSDTEVILNAYMEYGDAFVERIDGIFAIAICDTRVRKIKLFRDRVGVKPLYYFYGGDRFAYCSELKGIETLCRDVSFQVDNTAFYDYLTYGYVPDPKSIYKSVYKLPPACMLVYDYDAQKIVKKARYWRLVPNASEARTRSDYELSSDICEMIQQSVKDQMIADVPVGSFLSGGIDSSIITYEAQRINPLIESFSIGFSEKKFDELEYANMMSDTYHIVKNQQVVEKRDIEELYFKLKEWYDEPFADFSAFPSYLVSQMARRKVTVVLTGDGGDELFGGYRNYVSFSEKKIGNHSTRRVSAIYENCVRDWLKNGLRERADSVFMEDLARGAEGCFHGSLSRTVKKKYAEMWNIPADYDEYWYYRKWYKRELPPYTRLQYMDFHTYLPSDVLTKVDRVSMQVSLEARVPLLSKKLIEYAFSLTQEERCGGNVLKRALKKAYEGAIPDEILYRRKMGFTTPANFLKRKSNVREQLLNDMWKDEMQECNLVS